MTDAYLAPAPDDPRLGAAMDVRFEASVAEFASFVRDLGLDHVELKREYLEGHPETPTPAELARIREAFELTLTLHAPFRDWNPGSFNESVRRASVEMVKDTLTDAAVAGAGAVVVHGGSVPRRYPDHVREQARENAVRSLQQCAAHAEAVGVPLCLENQPESDEHERYTTTPETLAATLDAVGANPEVLAITLDVGHAKVSGVDPQAFVDRFSDRIRIVHLHDNDGTGDHHDPHPDPWSVVDQVGAPYNVLETKAMADIRASVDAG